MRPAPLGAVGLGQCLAWDWGWELRFSSSWKVAVVVWKCRGPLQRLRLCGQRPSPCSPMAAVDERTLISKLFFGAYCGKWMVMTSWGGVCVKWHTLENTDTYILIHNNSKLSYEVAS